MQDMGKAEFEINEARFIFLIKMITPSHSTHSNAKAPFYN
jgi:hypothetical protein